MSSPQTTALCVVPSSGGREQNGQTFRGRRDEVVAWQVNAAIVQYDLITRDLPSAAWSISPFRKGLDVHCCGTDEEVRAGVAEWAAYFQTEPRIEVEEDFVQLQVEVEYAGVPIKVWGQTDKAYTYVKVNGTTRAEVIV